MHATHVPGTKVAFVGQRLYFELCSMTEAADGIEPVFVDHRGGVDAGPMLARLGQLDPDVVVVFRPEIIPAGAFAGLRALTLGVNTEPLPREAGDAGRPGQPIHHDLAFRLQELADTDTCQFDRIATFDPYSAQAARDAGLDVWRSFPLPVADRVYRDITPMAAPPRVAFVGYSTEHRERWLVDAKHHYDVLHVIHGVIGDDLLDLYPRIDVALNLHNQPYLSFENRVCWHLAGGHLVISEPLSPLHGLEPGIDFIEVRTPRMLLEAITGLRALPGVHDVVRRRGRRKAEQFRASRVWPRVLADLRRDVAAFGTRRAPAKTSAS